MTCVSVWRKNVLTVITLYHSMQVRTQRSYSLIMTWKHQKTLFSIVIDKITILQVHSKYAHDTLNARRAWNSPGRRIWALRPVCHR